MNQIQLIIFAIIFQVKTFITFDSGVYNKFDYTVDSSFVCKNRASYSKTLMFSGTFANTPKFIMSPFLYDMDTAKNEFTFLITGINTTGVNFTMTSPQPNNQRMYAYEFSWIAVDDQRIEVINNGMNKNVTGIINKTFIFSHQNINSQKGYVSLTSLGYNGSISFSLTISSINTTSVLVNFTTSNYNLLSVGFQLILGTTEALSISSMITQQITSSVYYQSSNLTIPNGYNLSLPFSAMSYDNSQNIRINKVTTLSQPYTSYQFYCWGGSYQNSLSHQQVWVGVANSKIYYSFTLKKMRATSLFSKGLDSNRWSLYIQELNQFYTSSTTQTLLIDKNTQTLTLVYKFQCITYWFIQGSILKCPTCLSQFQYSKFQQYCYKNMNLITYQIVLYQPDPIYQQINLILTTTGFSITESVLNQFSSSTYTVMTLQVVSP